MKKLLVANRGEIAVRVIKCARTMGIRTVAVYSEADANSMHTALADEAVPLGASEPTASYLDMRKILNAAKETNADAIHPGYGFLSERAEFSEACESAGIVFVGPSAGAMQALGSKIDSKQLAIKAGVPITPGSFERDATPDRLEQAALAVGYPVMLKASAGGGGRGMREVHDPTQFQSQLRMASDEALKAFGDGAMMVEKLVQRPRHIEVQVLADKHGNVVCLYERECSLQRRHQKILEEAPSPIGARIWPRLKDYAESLIKAAKYTNAGTVEFIYDETTDGIYFMEVNARLQVEHPVTEAITGLDLVQWQIRIARGEKLDLPELMGERPFIHGHSIEARVVAEDPAQGFLPSIGKTLAWAEPKAPGIRLDTGFSSGSEVSRYYDSLLAKVIAHGETREDAIEKLLSALLDFHVLGVKTNIPYLIDILRDSEFRAGRIDTGFLDREFAGWSGAGDVPPELANILSFADSSRDVVVGEPAVPSVWATSDAFRN